ncbi:MAG: tetraacyldisaccharide 4'-kinase [Rhodospirillales bacterium]
MRAPDFWGPGRTSFSGRSMAALLSPLGHVYGAVTASRARRPAAWEAPVPVICVGNAVMGGAGKTQVAIDLAGRLTRAGKTPHILTRGYGGRFNGTVRVDPETHTADDVGDEALLLAEHAPVWRGADRVRDAQAACDAGAGVIVMDDGFQNPALAKTLNLLVVDGDYGFGNGRVFPAGPLREPVESALARAGAAVVIGGDADALGLPASLPLFRASVRPATAAAGLSGKTAIAFAGIGRPEKFFRTLADAGVTLAATHAFADHHAFRPDELKPLIAAANDAGAVLVTTAKDIVRVPGDLRTHVTPFPVQLAWEDERALESFILEQSGLN